MLYYLFAIRTIIIDFLFVCLLICECRNRGGFGRARFVALGRSINFPSFVTLCGPRAKLWGWWARARSRAGLAPTPTTCELHIDVCFLSVILPPLALPFFPPTKRDSFFEFEFEFFSPSLPPPSFTWIQCLCGRRSGKEGRKEGGGGRESGPWGGRNGGRAKEAKGRLSSSSLFHQGEWWQATTKQKSTQPMLASPRAHSLSLAAPVVVSHGRGSTFGLI